MEVRDVRGSGQKHYTFTSRYQHNLNPSDSPQVKAPSRRAVDNSIRNLSFVNNPASPPPAATTTPDGTNSAGKRRRREVTSPGPDGAVAPRSTPLPPNILVAVRLRSLLPKEVEAGFDYAWSIDKAQNTICEAGSTNKHTFDYVCPPGESTTQMYKHCIRKTVTRACYGSPSNVFVYGPTGSGKSFTAMGTNVAPGLVLLAIGDVFHVIQKTPDRQFLLRVSCCEIYENSLDDLLGQGTNLKLESTKGDPFGVRIKELTREFVRSATEFIAVLIRAAERRKKLAETAPDRAIKGHAIFRINIESRPRKAKRDDGPPSSPEENPIKSSVLTIADLGGSESFPAVNFSENPDESMTSAHELLSVLSTSGDPGKGKLARLLRSGLSNGSHVALICTVSPVQENIPQSSQSVCVGLLARAANKPTGRRLQTTKRNLGVVKKNQRIVDAIKVAVDKTRVEEQTKIRELQTQLDHAKLREQMMNEKPGAGDENSREYLELKLRIMEGQIRLWEEKLGPYLEENRSGVNPNRGAEIQVRQLQEIVEKLRDQNKDLEDTKRRDRDKQERERKEQSRLEMLLEEKRLANQEHAAELASLKETLIRERAVAMSGVILATKCYGRGQRHTIKLRLRSEDRVLVWTSGRLSKERCLKLSDVTSLNLGQGAPVFASLPENLRDVDYVRRSFSLVTPSRSLNVIMPSQIAYDIWVEGLKSMLPVVAVQDFRAS